MSLADEVKRLSVENATMVDVLSHGSVEYVIETLAPAIRAELENYDRVMEGLKKLGAFQETTTPMTPATTESGASGKRVSFRKTPSPAAFNVEDMRKALAE